MTDRLHCEKSIEKNKTDTWKPSAAPCVYIDNSECVWFSNEERCGVKRLSIQQYLSCCQPMNQCAAVKVYLHWKQDHNEWMNFNSTNVSMWSTKKIQKSFLQNFIELFNLWKWNFTLRHIQIFHLNGMVPPESAPGPNWIRDRCPLEFINRLTVRRQSAARTNHTISGKRAARKNTAASSTNDVIFHVKIDFFLNFCRCLEKSKHIKTYYC